MRSASSAVQGVEVESERDIRVWFCIHCLERVLVVNKKAAILQLKQPIIH